MRKRECYAKKTTYLFLLVCVILFVIFRVHGGSLYNIISFLHRVISKLGVWNCAFYLRNGLNKTVDDTFIDNLKRLCYNTSYQWNGESFDNYFLDHSIKTLECPESATFLKTRKPLVALASFPGSGNSWTRQLIEVVTETYTGSIYEERQTGSKVCPARGSVFIVKTHLTSNSVWTPKCKLMKEKTLNYTKVIYILRNPFDAILAEFNRQTAHLLNVATNEQFKSTNFRKKVHSLSTEWISMNKYWLAKPKVPTHVIVYEKQLAQTVLEMYQLMKFLDLPVKAKSLLCMSKFTVERRQKPDWLKPSNLYDAELRRVVNNAINEVAESIGKETEIGKLIQNYQLN